jgi:hypothetical protein
MSPANWLVMGLVTQQHKNSRPQSGRLQTTAIDRERRFAQAISKCINMTAITDDVDRHQACDLTFQ